MVSDDGRVYAAKQLGVPGLNKQTTIPTTSQSIWLSIQENNSRLSQRRFLRELVSPLTVSNFHDSEGGIWAAPELICRSLLKGAVALMRSVVR